MKKILSLILLVTVYQTTVYAQNNTRARSNYIDESIAIARFEVLLKAIAKKEGIVLNATSVSLDNDNNATITNGSDLKRLIDSIMKQVNAASKANNTTTAATGNTGNGIVMHNSGNPTQQGSINNANNNSNSTNTATISTGAKMNSLVDFSDNDKNAIEEELEDLVLLIYGRDNMLGKAENYTDHFNYINQILDATNKYFEAQSSSQKVLQGSDNKLFGNTGNLESQIIYGITDFAIKRAKEEILESHLTYLYNHMASDTILQQLLPHTLGKMKAFIDDNSISLAKYGGLWRSAFQEDLRNIPVVMQNENLVAQMLTSVGVKNNILIQQLAPAVSGGDRLVYNLYLKKNIVQILSDMSADYMQEYDGKTNEMPVFDRIVVMADVMAGALGSMTDNGYELANIENVKLMDNDSWDIFFKLLYLRHKAELEQVLSGNAKRFVTDDDKRGALITAVSKTMSLFSSFNSILPRDGGNVSVEDISRIYDLQLQIVSNGIEYIKVFKGADSNTSNLYNIVGYYEHYVSPILTDISEIGSGLSAHKYGKVLDGTLNIITTASSINKAKKKQQCAAALAKCESDCTAQYGKDGSSEKKKCITKCQKKNDTCVPVLNGMWQQYLTKYGSFMINVLDAKTGDEVSEALDEVIPQGLYKLKFSKKWSITASMYPGGFCGAEKLISPDAENSVLNYRDNDGKGISTSVYLPIGIDINKGLYLGGKKDRNAAIGLFLQVVDLGAVMNFRLNADSAESVNPTISFQQLLSPGASLMWHFPNSPIVIGCGVNYTPALRDIKNGTAVYEASALRYGGFLAIDITAIPLFLSKKDVSLAK